LAALFIHTIISNQYLSIVILTAAYFLIPQLPELGIENHIFRFNQNPEPDFFLKFSDLSGYGHSLIAYFIYKVYWLIFGLILFILTLLFWQRGLTQSFRERLRIAKSRFNMRVGFGMIFMLILFIGMGYRIYKTDNSSEGILSEAEIEKIFLESGLKYNKFRFTVQPRITSVKVNMNIFPASLSFNAEGIYSIKNKSVQTIDTLLVNYGFNMNTKYSFDKGSTIISRDTISHFDILMLNESLKPGDSLKLHFEVQNIPNTLLHKNSPIEKNGTFITSEIFPGLGYYSHESYADINDIVFLRNHYRSIDSDFIEFETTVSTDADQTAIAPGYLTKEWTEQGRRYFKYNSDGKVTNDYAFISGEYEIKKDKLNDVTLEIYYHKGHEYNLEHLMNGLKAGLEYSENNFGPYQHRHIRLLEYSRSRGNFAMSFANTIPYSESNFIMDIDDSEEGGLNLPFLGAAHELSHQWWGHQVIPANVDGVRMITESMAEYVSLKTLEDKYGKAKVNKFLKKARDIYLKV
jgi:ABC-2 type transport system permease protein